MFALVAQYQRSDLSMKAFSEAQGIKLSTFSYWVRKKKRIEAAQDSGNFIPLDLQAEENRGDGFEMIYPNGVRLRLPHFDKDQIRQLINIYGC